MASINKLSPGQTVYSVERRRMGNTTIRIGSLFGVKIISVDVENHKVVASWNGNPPKVFYAKSIKAWKVKKPEPKGTLMGMPSY